MKVEDKRCTGEQIKVNFIGELKSSQISAVEVLEEKETGILNAATAFGAKYVYGVTATPFRGDGMEKINYMLLGPIRYRFTSKDRAKEQGIWGDGYRHDLEARKLS